MVDTWLSNSPQRDNNTIVTQSSFAIFGLQTGENASGGTGGDPQYARNDAGPATITFGSQL